MGRRIGPGQIDHAFIAGQRAIGGQGKAAKAAGSRQPGKDMGSGKTLMVAALRADMVKRRTVANLDLQHRIEPGGGRATFQ